MDQLRGMFHLGAAVVVSVQLLMIVAFVVRAFQRRGKPEMKEQCLQIAARDVQTKEISVENMGNSRDTQISLLNSRDNIETTENTSKNSIENLVNSSDTKLKDKCFQIGRDVETGSENSVGSVVHSSDANLDVNALLRDVQFKDYINSLVRDSIQHSASHPKVECVRDSILHSASHSKFECVSNLVSVSTQVANQEDCNFSASQIRESPVLEQTTQSNYPPLPEPEYINEEKENIRCSQFRGSCCPDPALGLAVAPLTAIENRLHNPKDIRSKNLNTGSEYNLIVIII